MQCRHSRVRVHPGVACRLHPPDAYATVHITCAFPRGLAHAPSSDTLCSGWLPTSLHTRWCSPLVTLRLGHLGVTPQPLLSQVRSRPASVQQGALLHPLHRKPTASRRGSTPLRPPTIHTASTRCTVRTDPSLIRARPSVQHPPPPRTPLALVRSSRRRTGAVIRLQLRAPLRAACEQVWPLYCRAAVVGHH